MVLIYLIRNKVNGKVYVGKTTHLVESRWKSHIKLANKGGQHHFHKAIRKYGLDSFSVRTIVRARTVNRANELERKFIKKYKSYPSSLGFGYNMTKGGDGFHGEPWNKGKKLPKWLCKKLSKARRGIAAPNFTGRRHSKESKRKISESQKGNRRSKTFCLGVSERNRWNINRRGMKTPRITCERQSQGASRYWNSLTPRQRKNRMKKTIETRLARHGK